MGDLATQVREVWTMLQGLTVQWGLKVLGAIVVFLIGQMIARSVRRGMTSLFERTEMSNRCRFCFFRDACKRGIK